MVPFAVKANTACRHNATGTVGGRPSAQGAPILIGREVVWSPARDRMSLLQMPGTRPDIIFLQTVQLTCTNACPDTG